MVWYDGGMGGLKDAKKKWFSMIRQVWKVHEFLVSSLIFCGFPLDLISSHTAQLHIFTFQLREKVKGGNEGNTGAIVE